MAILFLRQKKTQGYLILFLTVFAAGAGFLIWKFFSEKNFAQPEIKPEKKIEINLEILKNPVLKELRLPEGASLLEGEVGRENPFVPYQGF